MDKQEFTMLVLEAEDSLYRVAWSILRNDADCQDAVQEAVLRAWEQLPRLRRREFFRTWLTRIVIRESCRLRETGKRFLPLEVLPEASSCDGGYVWREIQALPEPLRLPAVLHYVEGYSVAEAGKILGLPTGTIKSRLSRARKTLRAKLEV